MPDGTVIDRIRSAISTYYAGSPEISDEEYEELISESGLGWKDVENLKRESVVVLDKIRHLHPMTSLPKVRSLEEVAPISGSREYQLKLDGSSLEIHYDSRGGFDWAATRGDYTNGDNRTGLVRSLIDLQRVPETYLPNVSVRGELLISNLDWPSLENGFANQRNAASGISNRDDQQYTRFLTFIAYDVIDDDSGECTHVDGDRWGAVTYGGGNESLTESVYQPLSLGRFSTFDEAQYAFEHSYYPVDGVVIKDYDGDGVEQYAVAYKFSDKTYETVLRDVKWQIGKSGKLTPVAEFDPVFIDAEVKRASLGSYQIFRDLDLHYDDHILVKKANMVIPQVVQNLHGGVTPVSVPRFYNGHETNVIGQHLYTQNDQAWRQRLYAQVNDVAGKGIGPSFIDRAIESYGIRDIYELYTVVNDETTKIPSAGERTMERARQALSKIENVNMSTFISSLHIDGLGVQQSERIANKIATVAENEHREQWEVLKHIRYPYEFAFAIDGVGDVLAKTFKDNMSLIRENLDNYAETFHHYPASYTPVVIASDDSKEVVITGKLDVPRREAARELIANGYRVSPRVAQDTDYVIQCGDRDSGKTKEAERLGVRIIRCTDLNDALNQLKNLDGEDDQSSE